MEAKARAWTSGSMAIRFHLFQDLCSLKASKFWKERPLDLWGAERSQAGVAENHVAHHF